MLNQSKICNCLKLYAYVQCNNPKLIRSKANTFRTDITSKKIILVIIRLVFLYYRYTAIL